MSAECGSTGLAETFARLVTVVPGVADAATFTTSVTVAATVALRLPVHAMSPAVGPAQASVSLETRAKAVPAGIESLTMVSVTSLGPWFVTVIV